MSLSAEDVEDIARDPATHFIVQQLKEVPNHTQAVERLIPLSTEVSKTYPVEAAFPVDRFGKPVDRFEQEMSSTLFSRKVMLCFCSKQDYRTHKNCKVHKISGPNWVPQSYHPIATNSNNIRLYQIISESAIFDFFCLVDIITEKSWFLTIFRAPGQFWNDLWAENHEILVFPKILLLFQAINRPRVDQFLIFWSRWLHNWKISLSRNFQVPRSILKLLTSEKPWKIDIFDKILSLL